MNPDDRVLVFFTYFQVSFNKISWQSPLAAWVSELYETTSYGDERIPVGFSACCVKNARRISSRERSLTWILANSLA